MPAEVTRLLAIPEVIGKDLEGFGGYLRCETCFREEALGDVGHKIAKGWPKCHDATMRWWTAKQIAAGEVPQLLSPFG